MIDEMLARILRKYLAIFNDERDKQQLLITQIRGHEKLNNRNNFAGHITGSAIVLSPDRKKILLIYHKVFNVWQQPGGHWEAAEPNPLEAARREAIEETNATISAHLSLLPDDPLVPLDIDTHQVPARESKKEPVHFHHDIRYVFVAADNKLNHQEKEVDAAKWFSVDDTHMVRLGRCIAKLKHFGFI